MFEEYQGKVVQIMGGLHDFVGEIETFEDRPSPSPAYEARPPIHPNGEGWIRILKPCTTEYVKEKHNRILCHIVRLGGPQHDYAPFVDIYIPPRQSLYEIRVLDTESQMHKVYQEEANRQKPKHIVLPGDDNKLHLLNQ